MCVVSLVTDHYTDKWKQLIPIPFDNGAPTVYTPAITAEEIQEFRKLLERAREYDKRNNEPECELAEKRETLKKIAKQLGVEIEFL